MTTEPTVRPTLPPRALILGSPIFGRVLTVVGLSYFVVVALILLNWLPLSSTLRGILWGVGVVEIGLVIAHWWYRARIVETRQNVEGPDRACDAGEAPPEPAAVAGAAPEVVAANAHAGWWDKVKDRIAWLFDSLKPDAWIAWLVAYPLFPLELVLMCAISWLGFMDGFGIPDLLWDDDLLWQFFNGLAVSLLFVNVLTVRYTLDHRPNAPTSPFAPPAFAPGRRDSLYPKATDPEVWRLGAFLLRTWVPALAVFYLPKAGRMCLDGRPLDSVGMLLGILVGVGIPVVFSYRFDSGANRSRFTTWVEHLVAQFPTFASRQVRPAELPLLARAARTTVLPFIVLTLLVLLNLALPVIWHPIWLICLMMALFNSLYGIVAFHFSGLQYVLVALAALVAVVCNTQHPGKMSFPALDRATLGLPPGEDESTLVDLDNLGGNEPLAQGLGLVNTEKMLANFHDRWTAGAGAGEKDKNDRLPKLVIVANSGGGIRAAVWTAVVLQKLEEAMPGDVAAKKAAFRDHIRLMTGASGGMVAAGLYAAGFEQGPRDLASLLKKDSLWPTLQTMLLHDLPGVGVPWALGHDRGRSLEDAWVENTRPDAEQGVANRVKAQVGIQTRAGSPFEKSFRELRRWTDEKGVVRSEEGCDRPSVIFSPMMVEDCRRLLITNLDLKGQTTLKCAGLNGELGPFKSNEASVPVVDFWRAFPNADATFKVKTAARMSATFPFVGPGVSLPTNPRRRVVDAGYFDNFGINLAAIWLWRYRDEIRKHTSGVVLVEVRAYPRRAEKLYVNPANAREKGVAAKNSRPELMSWALSEVSTPAEAIVNLYARGAYFRNDVQMEILDSEFNKRPAEAGRPFFTTAVFECNGEAALSWTLPDQEFEQISSSFDEQKQKDGESRKAATQLKEVLDRLKEWFGVGGTR